MKRFTAAILAIILTFSLFSVSSFAEEKKAEKDEKSAEEKVPEKEYTYKAEEVIYGVLEADGDINKILPVVILDAEKDSPLTYYGDFTEIKNLTDTSKLESKNGKLELSIPKGRFYFEGQLKKAEIPWNVKIEYRLDGKKISAEDLGGKSGKLEIDIKISANEKADKSFFDAYLLQLSATLNSDSCKNISAEGATLANAGSNKMINFMSMPGSESKFHISADVTDFAMGGMSIAAVPISMADMLGSMDGISEGIDEFSSAMEQLSGGVSQLNNGAWQLNGGMRQFSNGLLQLSANSAAIRDTSQMLLDGLRIADDVLGAIAGNDMGSINPDMLPDTIRNTAQLIYLSADAIRAERDNIVTSKNNMYEAFGEDRSEINDAGLAYIANLEAAWNVSAVLLDNTITKLELAENDVRISADGLINAADVLESLVNAGGEEWVDISQYVNQFRELLQNFQLFYDGIIQYTQAVDMLAENGVKIADGVEGIAGGTNQLNSGTSRIPEEMNEMLSEMAGDDFEAHSFISEKNENIQSVQFVFSTEAISVPEIPAEEADDGRQLSGAELFLKKLKELFQTDES